MISNAVVGHSIEDMAILIVDDSDVTRLILESSLRTRGFSNILAVENGERGLQEVERFKPDLMILDIMMPGIDGLTCCRAIRELPQGHELPILIGTSATDIGLRLRAFESGATDFINTPILPDELGARVRVHLQNRKYIKELQSYKQRMTSEMNNAYQLQSSILPRHDEFLAIHAHSRLDVASHFEPSSEIGGDFWGMKAIEPHKAAIWMMDFSGHGITAALNAFRLQAYLKQESALAALPGDYISELNGKLLQLLLSGHFATMFYGVLNTERNELTYSSACAPSPILLTTATGGAQFLEGRGNLLGISPHNYPTYHVPMHPGDMLILYSDALTETPDPAGRMIAEESLLELVSKHKDISATHMLNVIMAYFKTHSAGHIFDDFTLCVFRRLP